MINLFRPKFERCVEPELPVLYRVAKRMTSSSENAEDLVSQTLLQAFRAWASFDGRFLRSWLIVIMRRERNRLYREPSRVDLEIDELDQIPDHVVTWDLVSDRLQAAEIRAAIDQLETGYRLAICLCDVEGMSYEEAAAALEVPIGTVRSRLSRARAAVRRSLSSQFSPEIPV